MSSLRVTALAVAVLLLAPAAAVADTPVGELPTPSSEQLAESVSVLAPEIVDLASSVTQLETSVVELAATSTDGGEEVITLTSDILFDFDESDLSAAARRRIATLVDDVPEGAAVDIGGHTDSMGSTAYNQRLSTARATAVAAVVRKSRPDLDLTVTGFGEARPVAPNTSGGEDDPVGRAENRRVEIRFGT